MKDESRRKFLGNLLTLASAIPVMGAVACASDNKDIEPVIDDTCDTTKDILGPFYRADAPSRVNLNVLHQEGTALEIAGIVFGEDCTIPLANAKIEIWHASDHGAYDNTTENFEFRGIVTSDQDGQYGFNSILPGRYLNGSTYRPSHVHFKITADGYQDLVTQLYFKNDPYIDTDPWASDKEAEDRIIDLVEDNDGQLSGIFNIKLLKK